MSEIQKSGAVVKDEIASIRRDPLHPLFSGLIQPNDETLASRGQGKGVKLYEEVERDPHVFACLNKRKMAVISRPWEVTAASEDALDVRAAELVRVALAEINFDALCLNLLDAINKGFAVAEVMWTQVGSEIAVSGVLARNQTRFWFGEQSELRLKTLENLLPGEELPPRKFVVHSVGSKDGNPYGLGLGSKLFWPVWFKRQGITFWLTFLDKFGSPTAVGKYPTGTQPSDQAVLLNALAAISQDAGVVIPAGMEIVLLEATRGGNAGYEAMCRYMDEQIAYCILGEAPSAKSSGGAAASAAITRNEVRLELVQFDADILSATLNASLIRWLVEFNVPGAKPPTLWRKVVEAEDIKLRAERDKILFEMGLRPDEAYQAENYAGWSFPKGGVGDSVSGVAFAEAAGDGNPTAAEEDALVTATAGHWSAMVAQLKTMTDAATDLGSLPSDELVRVMAAGFALAELKGLADVSDGL
jgi:phage gp29-like protein